MPRFRRAQVDPDMNVTPLVDVVLVLLIIFMVVAPQLNQDVQLDIPGIFNPDPEVEGNMNPIKVSVARAGEYHIDQQPFDLQGALDYLATQRTAEPNRRLVLRADDDLKYGSIREFMARVQQMGFPGVNFMVGEKHRQGAVRASADYAGREELDTTAPATAPDGAAMPDGSGSQPAAPPEAESPPPPDATGS